jgi:hypothetical protein
LLSHCIQTLQKNTKSQKIVKRKIMALQLGIRRSLVSTNNKVSLLSSFGAEVTGGRRYKSTDAGDVIGIDLGTTNSCVAVMVS